MILYTKQRLNVTSKEKQKIKNIIAGKLFDQADGEEIKRKEPGCNEKLKSESYGTMFGRFDKMRSSHEGRSLYNDNEWRLRGIMY